MYYDVCYDFCLLFVWWNGFEKFIICSRWIYGGNFSDLKYCVFGKV